MDNLIWMINLTYNSSTYVKKQVKNGFAQSFNSQVVSTRKHVAVPAEYDDYYIEACTQHAEIVNIWAHIKGGLILESILILVDISKNGCQIYVLPEN